MPSLSGRSHWLYTVAAALVLGCAASGDPDPARDSSSVVRVTSEGLVPIAGSGFANGWLKPGVTFSDYDSVVLAPTLVAYKRAPRKRGGGAAGALDDDYPLNDEQLATLLRYFDDAFRRELGKTERLRLIPSPRARTLIVAPALTDLVIMVPTDSARVEDSFSSSTAKLTLLLDVRDAETGVVLARVSERRAARTPGSIGTEAVTRADYVNTAAAMRTTFGRWANLLREQLDRIQSRPPLEVVAVPSN